jgi:hypothetical protein
VAAALGATVRVFQLTSYKAGIQRARIIESLHSSQAELERSWRYRLGFAPLRRLFGMFKDGRR